MQIWLLINRKKEGPSSDYEIRERIDAGDIPKGTLAWHEGMEKWQPVETLTPFRSAFSRIEENELIDTVKKQLDKEQLAETVQEVEVGEQDVREYLDKHQLLDSEAETHSHDPKSPSSPSQNLPPTLNQGQIGLFLVRRTFARLFDIFSYYMCIFAVISISGNSITDFLMNENKPLLPLIMILPWIIIDGGIIHLWGTTLGKWVMGLRIEKHDSTNIGLTTSVFRSLRAWIIGMGMMNPLFLIISAPLSLFLTKRNKATPWDFHQRIRCRAVPLKAGHVISYICFLIVISIITGEAIPQSERQKTQAKLQEMMDQAEGQSPFPWKK